VLAVGARGVRGVQQVHAQIGQARDSVAFTTVDYVRRRPLRAVALALTTGLIVGTGLGVAAGLAIRRGARRVARRDSSST